MKIIQNVLSQDTIDLFKKETFEKFKLDCWRISVLSWQQILTKNFSGRVYSSYVSDNLWNKVMSDIKFYIPQCENVKYIQIQHYIWDVNSGIHIHEDATHLFGATIYMNENWDINDGGLFIYVDQLTKEKKLLVPEFNTMVINDAKIDHMVTHISPYAPSFRVTLQIWGD